MSRFAGATALAAVLLLSACAASGPPPPPAEPPPPPARERQEPADADRRAQVRLELAAAYFGRGQTPTALEELKQVLALKPDMVEAHSLMALIHASTGDVRAAETSFRRTLQLDPRNPDTMHNFGWFLCQQRRFDEADAQFQAALASPGYRDSARTLLVAGVCQARAGRWPEAERLLGRSFELDPANPSTAYNLSDVLYRRGEFERARFYLKRVNATPDTSNPLSLWLAVRVERKLNNPPGVQDIGRQLRDRFPNAPETFLFEQGKFDE